MPLIYRTVGPAKLSSGKLELKGKTDSEFIAVNNETFVNILRQLASVVTHAGDIFSDVASLTEQVGKRVRSVKLRLDELEAKADLFDPKLVPVPEGTLDDISNACTLHHRLHGGEHNEELVQLETTNLVGKDSRPKFLLEMYDNAGTHEIFFPPRSPILSSSQSLERQISMDSRRPASFAALRDWKLDDYLDDKIKTIGRKKQSAEALNRALASPFPSQVVQVNVTGAVFDRMKANRRSLVVHTKKIRKKRRNTICGSMPNKECGIQTSFNSIPLPGGTDDGTTSGEHRGKKYGIDSGHWSSSCTSSAQGVPGIGSCCSAPSPWDPNSLSTSSDFLFDEEDRCLTPQLENFTDGLVSDSDSVDTDGYFTSFRSDCGFPRMKKSASQKELEEVTNDNPGSSPGEKDGKDTACNIDSGMSSTQSNSITVAMATAKRISITENEYELFGKGSTSTTASSCGTVVMRNKPEPPARTTSTAVEEDKVKGQGNEDPCLEERVKRKSLIEVVPSLVVVTPSPSCSSGSPPPLKDPGIVVLVDENISAEDSDSGRLTPKADDLFTTNESECGTLSDTDSDRRTEVRLSDIAIKKRSTSSTSSTGTASTTNSTLTLTSCPLNSGGLPQPDVIPADAVVQQLQIIRTNKATPRLDAKKEYYSLDTVLLGSFEEELRHPNGDCKMNLEKDEKHSTPPLTNGGVKKAIQCTSPPPNGVATSGKIRGARVVLDANGEIIFSSETLRRKRKQKVSFDPGSAVKSPDYDSNSQYSRVRESVYDRIKKDTADPEKLYECIEEIRRHNLKPRDQYLDLQQSPDQNERSTSSASSLSSSPSKSSSTPDPGLLETDLDSAIPPVMPDLKNLPKIKDRLKRNESYRIANTDEAAAKPASPSPTPGKLKLNGIPNRSPLSSLHFNRNPSKRMLLTSPPSTSPTPLHLNKKRDIPEEDPTFIQQIFSINSAANNKLNVNGNNAMNNSSSSPFHLSTPDNSNKVLSKFSITPEDRPSFLRRDSPPTMDDIAKEIYRFRKKFNIQPNASTTTLTRPIQRGPEGIYSTGSLRRQTESQVRTLPRPSSSTAQYPNVTNLVKSTIPVGFPRLSLQHPKSPIAPPPRRPQSSSGGVININRSPVHSSVYYPSYGWSTSPASTPPKCSTPIGLPIPPSSSAFGRLFSPSQSTPPIPPTRNFSSRKIFPMRAMSSTSNSGSSTPTSVHSLPHNQYQSANDHRLVHPSLNNSPNSLSNFRNYLLPSLPFRRNSVAIGEGSSAFSKSPRTSIGEFKKLLQATQKKRSSISAVEVLKPKGLETTI